jgi:hypothetical protein
VVGAAEAFTIGGVEWMAAVTALDLVVCEEAMGWRGLRAALAALDPLAAIAGVAQHGFTELTVSVGLIERIGTLWLDLDGPTIRLRDHRSH